MTDCVSMQTMRLEGLTEVLTNDRHFEQEDFRVLSAIYNRPLALKQVEFEILPVVHSRDTRQVVDTLLDVE